MRAGPAAACGQAPCATASGRAEPAGALLHNVGGPPRATITWRGPDRFQAGGTPRQPGEAPAACSSRGMWLQLTISIGQRDERYRRDWNTAAALLDLVEPGHGLAEPAAQSRLVDFIEEETARRPWPASLLAARGGWTGGQSGESRLEFDHAPATFVAMSKCTGSLWLRHRRPHLAPLHAPVLIEPGSTPMRGVRWSQMLWFAQGIPQELLSALGTPKAQGNRGTSG
jgi:hypothetical protein